MADAGLLSVIRHEGERSLRRCGPGSDAAIFLCSVDRPSDGKVSELLKLEFQPRPDLSASPDEQYVLLAKPDEKGTDLMLVEGFR